MSTRPDGSKLYRFEFANFSSSVYIREEFPRSVQEILPGNNPSTPALVVCDENTAPLARLLALPIVVLPPGEKHKNWPVIETILHAAKANGLGRDSFFIGLGGGVICDLTAFAASIYMRGARLALIPTTLLCMVDAVVGGKTGLNFEGIKNLAGTFYPAEIIVIAAESLKMLSGWEWKSGMAELIKTAILDKNPAFLEELQQKQAFDPAGFLPLIKKAVHIKGRIVEEDPRENHSEKTGRVLLNLGHSFGHALESAVGQEAPDGTISHGEAVAWGIARSCELGLELGITPPNRAEKILQTLTAWDFKTKANDFTADGNTFKEALVFDKKKITGKLRFVIPANEGAVLTEEDNRTTNYLNSLITRL